MFTVRTRPSIHLLLLVTLPCLPAAEVTVTILQTTDLHSRIASERRMDSGGDWLRVATIVKRERAHAITPGPRRERPAQNAIRPRTERNAARPDPSTRSG